MKNDIVLVRPTLELKEKALEYRKEHFQHGEKIIYGSELLDKTESYEEWQEIADIVYVHLKEEEDMRWKCYISFSKRPKKQK